MSKGIAITYGDIAVGAKEEFVPAASEDEFGTVDNLSKNNMELHNYTNPCELYKTVLDGSGESFPQDPSKANIGLVSVQMSSDDYTFAEPIVLTFVSEHLYSSQGLTFTFDKFNNIHPKRMSIKWERITTGGVTVLSEKEFEPNSGFYFCHNKVENYNKVTVTIYNLNMPRNRLRLEAMEYGYGTTFYGNELRNVSIKQLQDPISSEMQINTCDFELDSKNEIEYSFQSKQPLSVSFNDNYIMTLFVDSSTRKAKKQWSVSAIDYIGTMSNSTFAGGIYENVSAKKLLDDIFTAANVPYEIDETFEDVTLSGYIPHTDCREALMQVCFAALLVTDTCGHDYVYVKKLSEEVSQIIPAKRIMQGQSFSSENVVTKVSVTEHSYAKGGDITELYNAESSGEGENIFVQFSEPMYNLQISHGEIVKEDTNYAIISTYGDACVLNGRPYVHTTKVSSKINVDVAEEENFNVKTIDGATLVSSSNIEAVLENCYNNLIAVNTTSMSIVDGKTVTYVDGALYGIAVYDEAVYDEEEHAEVTYDKPVNVGDLIQYETEYSGIKTGRIIDSSYSLNGNIIVKAVTVIDI